MNLTPITVEDYPRLQQYFQRQPYRLCCYSLVAIITWQNDKYRPLAYADGDTVLIGADYQNDPDKRHLILPVSSRRGHDPEELARMAALSGYDKYWFVPECYLDTWGKDAIRRFFRLTPQKGWDDYIYRTRDLADLKGNRYAKKRNLINQFTANYVDAGRLAVEPLTEANTEQCTVFLERWCEIMSCGRDTENDLACEKIAVINTLKHIRTFDVRGLVIRVDGAVSAFGIGARLTESMGVLHFEKAYPDIKGLYQYLDSLCARQLFSDYAFINKESDMSIPGLSKAKKSYHPVDMVKSYQLSLK